METVLEVKNLSVSLEGEEILQDVSFSVNKGEAVAIIGPNGSGKTVLLKSLLGLLPTEGEIKWREGTTLGYVPQKLAPAKSIPVTVREFFLLHSSNFWLKTGEFFRHLDHELRLVGLDEKILSKLLGEVSAGQFQRLLISWAMLNHPDVLLFDEPTAGIDIGFEETIYNLIHRLQDERGTTVILVSHDLHIVYRYAQKVLCLNKKLICEGSPQDVLNPEELARLYGQGGYFHPLSEEI